MQEIWKDIAGFENIYQVSNYGRVKSLHYGKEKILKQAYSHNGYLSVDLRINGKHNCQRVNRLVAQTFIPNPNNLPQVNHIDGNKTNNYVENLEWVTAQENTLLAFQNGLSKYETLIKARNKSISVTQKKIAQYDMQGNLIRVYNGLREAGRINNVAYQSILRALKGKRNHFHNYLWEYYKES